MDNKNFITAVKQMRDAQNDFFKNRFDHNMKIEALKKAKQLEALVDNMLEEMISKQEKLF